MPESSISHTQVVNFFTNNDQNKCYRLTLTVKENSYDIEANTSSITVTGIFEVTVYYSNTGGYAFEGQGTNPPQFITTNTTTGERVQYKELKSAKYDVKYNVCNLTLPSVPHNADGSLNVSYTITVNYNSGGINWYCPKKGTTITTSGALTNIPRGTDFELSTTMSTGANIIISRGTPAVQSYRHELYYVLNGSPYNLYHKSNASPPVEVTIPWGTIVGIIGTNVTERMTVTMETYLNSSAATPLATISKDVMVVTGRIPFSGYDNGAGDVGVTLGAKATGPGFSVQLPTTFGTDALHQDVNFTYANIIGASFGLQIDEVFSGAGSTGNWGNFSDYICYITFGCLNTSSVDNILVIPSMYFDTSSSGSRRVQYADDSHWVVYQFYQTGGRGYFKRTSQSTTNAVIHKVYGVRANTV